jgi:micrococcal nuclease
MGWSLVFSAGITWLATYCVLQMPPALAQRCSSFNTCADAIRSLQSGNTRIDGDGDGIPCESLCSGYGGGGGNTYSSPTPPRQTPKPRPAATAKPKPKPQPQVISGPVALISVGDGDTIRVTTANGQKVTVRLACIDAPETAQGQSGADATEGLKQLLASGSLELRPQTIDKYGRTVAEVYAGGQNVNVAMVANGAAYVYHQYLEGCDAGAYQGAEDSAMRRRYGVWRWDSGEQRPWDFRKSR